MLYFSINSITLQASNIKEEPVLHKLAHTQPTQYMLPPPPENPLKHYQEVIKDIPVRTKVISSDFKDKKEKQTYEIINELLTTEEGYLKDLAILIGVCDFIYKCSICQILTSIP